MLELGVVDIVMLMIYEFDIFTELALEQLLCWAVVF